MSNSVLFVRQCNQCGGVIADPQGLLDGFKSNSWCPKCRSSWMTYRRATAFERLKAALRLMQDPAVRAQARTDIKEVRAKLGQPGAVLRVAKIVMDVAAGRKS